MGVGQAWAPLRPYSAGQDRLRQDLWLRAWVVLLFWEMNKNSAY